MRFLFLSSVAMLALSTVAHAADAVDQVPSAPVAEEVQVFTWSGPYLGVHGGYGWTDGSFDISGVGTLGADLNGGLFGVFAGYNHQFSNNLVIGIEGDIEYNWNEEEVLAGAEARTELQGSVRGRIGYAFDRALVYATGGWAATQGVAEVPGFSDETETFNGYTVGAGVDYAFTNNIFGRVEYRYTDFGSKTFDFGAGTIDADLDQHAIRVGLGVKF
ncbi:outer membrane protein [Neorhizobium galegae]|uniref:25 kDa outer-membrane immunogenic protein n=1 Tax=Neorhizobium galegae bv. officinalis TaxID=323656 RepID=A0A0T7GRH0_NEOGA|nr:outer membrane protein [Neorhizobium galegae]CDZ49852.1 25 kDa outer-membrane immunogenic protein [Neorhizobium galegae bv. officinalis]